jgi:hypothetical protein
LNPKSEIKTASRQQSPGHKRFAKIAPDPAGMAAIFAKRFGAHLWTHPGRFYFGFRVEFLNVFQIICPKSQRDGLNGWLMP